MTKYLIGYTISDDETRERFKQKLEEAFGKELEWINESMYKLAGGNLQQVTKALRNIFGEIEKQCFGLNDFIKLYYAARLADYTDLPERDLIVEKNISASD